MLVGYARVSTKDQNLDLQTNSLKDNGCERLFEEKVSSTKKDRTELNRALDIMREGDTLVVWKLDRLGRSVKQLVSFVEDLHNNGMQFKSISDGIDTSTTAGKFFFHIMASLAEMERGLIVDRTQAGLAAARLKGRKGGRPRKMTARKIVSAKKLLIEGFSPTDVAEDLCISVPTLYRWIPASDIH
jgi:DNA invertase Pin-like site-specific DNA recombinase